MANQDTTHNSGRKRIDWVAAEAFYLALDPPRSFGTVAREFGVSDSRVSRVARERKWREKVVEADQHITDQINAQAVFSRAERVQKALSLVDGLLVRAGADIERLGKDLRPSDLPAIVKLAELLEGEATDRVALGEVQLVIQAVVAVAGRWVTSELPPAERRDGFLRELESATAGLSVEAAA